MLHPQEMADLMGHHVGQNHGDRFASALRERLGPPAPVSVALVAVGGKLEAWKAGSKLEACLEALRITFNL